MTPEDQERDAALMAVAHALSEAERQQLLVHVAVKWPRLRGAGVADVLDLTTDHDMFLEQTEPFFAGPGRPGGVIFPDSPAVLFAAHAVILLGRSLQPGYVTDILTRAGVMEGCPDGGTCHHYCLASSCFRVQAASPLSIAGFEGDRWPADVEARNGVLPGVPAPPPYDIAADLAVVLLSAVDGNYRSRTSPELAGALTRLRGRVDMTSAETVTEDLRGYFRVLLKKEA
jgi:hypothetical protein